jgi:hypothetical protein
MTVAGCTPAPSVAAKILRLRTRKPTVRLGVKAAERARRGVRAKAGAAKLPPSAIARPPARPQHEPRADICEDQPTRTRTTGE